MPDTHFWLGAPAIKPCSDRLGATGKACLLWVVALYFLAAFALRPLSRMSLAMRCRPADPFVPKPAGAPGRARPAFFILKHPLEWTAVGRLGSCRKAACSANRNSRSVKPTAGDTSGQYGIGLHWLLSWRTSRQLLLRCPTSCIHAVDLGSLAKYAVAFFTQRAQVGRRLPPQAPNPSPPSGYRPDLRVLRLFLRLCRIFVADYCSILFFFGVHC